MVKDSLNLLKITVIKELGNPAIRPERKEYFQ
jgi:hypothetical protein